MYRGIGEGWARFTYGGSTGGWEALAVQVKYPTEYNGCYAACPDLVLVPKANSLWLASWIVAEIRPRESLCAGRGVCL